MIIGVPKEIKNNEFRVSLTPSGVSKLISKKNTVLVEKDAGKNSSFLNDEYKKAGAIIVNTREEVFQKSEMILKVKEPIEEEYNLIKEGQIVFTYFHFASHRPLLDVMTIISVFFTSLSTNNGLESTESIEAEIFLTNSESLFE